MVWRDNEFIGERKLRLELPGGATKGQPKRCFIDSEREYEVVCVREKDRVRWRRIHCGCP